MTPSRIIRILPILLALTLGACASPGDHGPDSPYHAFPEQMRLTLHQPLAIPAEAATVPLQSGRIVPRNGVQEQEPHCVFEVNTVATSQQTVQPGTFQVTRVQRRVQTFSGMPVFHHYSLFRPHRVGLDRGDGPSHVYFITEFRLRSEQQPDVRSLTCLHNQAAPASPFARHLTLGEMRQALGAYFSLELPR